MVTSPTPPGPYGTRMRTGLLGKLLADCAGAGDASAKTAARHAAPAAASRPHWRQRTDGFLGCGRMWFSLIDFVFGRTAGYFMDVIPGPEPPGPAFGRPDDKLREGARNP